LQIGGRQVEHAPDQIVAGDRGVALRALDGAGPLNRAIERPVDPYKASASTDATVVSTDPRYGAIGGDATGRAPSRLWRCEASGREPVEGLPFAGDDAVSIDAPAGLLVRYTSNPDTFRDTFELWDLVSMSPIAPRMDLGAFNLTHIAVDRAKGWVVYGTSIPMKAEARDLACRTAGRNMTAAEWQQFGTRDQPYRPTCEQWPMPE
jgi:hypothetical protein